MSLCGIARLHSDQGLHLEAQTEGLEQLMETLCPYLPSLAVGRYITLMKLLNWCLHLLFFFPHDMRSKEINKKNPNPNQDVVCVSLPGFFHFDTICLGRFIVAQALITKS